MSGRPFHSKSSTYDRYRSSIQGLCDYRRLIALNPARSGATSNIEHAVSSRRHRAMSHFAGSARIGTRGGVWVAVGSVSTTEHRLFNGEVRGRSLVKVLVDHLAAAICNRCRLCSSSGNACSSRVCSDSHGPSFDGRLSSLTLVPSPNVRIVFKTISNVV